jgi:hypothetical protein
MYVSQLISKRDDKFFNWAASEAWRWGGRGMEGKTRQQSSVKNDRGEDELVDIEDTRGNLGFSDDQSDMMETLNDQEAEFGGESLSRETDYSSQELEDNAIFESHGLQGNKNVAKPGGVVQPEQMVSFFDNYEKIHSLYNDIIKGIQNKYQKAASALKTGDKSQESPKDVMINMLQKELLFSRIFSFSGDFVRNLFRNASNGKSIGVTSDRMAKIINQEWDNVMDAGDWERFSWDMNDPKISELVQKGVNDGLGTPESVYKGLVGKVQNNEGKLNSLAIQQKVPSGLPGLASIYLDPEIVNKHGKEALISFIDLTGYYSGTAKLGSLLSNTHPETYNDKLEYLTELVRRGVITNYTEDQIENMPINEVAEVFSGVRKQLQGLYGLKDDTIEAIEDPSNSYITDEDVANIAQSLGYPNVTNKKIFSGQPSKVKKDIAEKMFVSPKFQKFKLFVDKNDSVLKKMLEYYISKDVNNGKAVLEQSGMKNSIDVYSLPRRRAIQIANKFYPKLYQAFVNNQLSTTKVNEFFNKIRKTNTDDLEQAVINDFYNQISSSASDDEDGTGPSRKAILDQAIVFANILDLPSKSYSSASTSVAASVLLGLRKIASQRMLNSLISLKKKLSEHNRDVIFIDEIIKAKNE